MRGSGDDDSFAALPAAVALKGHVSRVHRTWGYPDPCPGLELGDRGARADQGDPDPRRFELLRQGFGEGEHEGLRRMVDREERPWDKARARPDVDYAARPRGNHGREEEPGQMNEGGDI